MAGFIRAVTELLRTIQDIAGGRIRGQIAFWVTFIIFVALAANPAYTSVSDVMSKLGLTFGLPQLFTSLLIALISAIAIVGIGAALGTLFGMFSALAFASKTRLNIDKVFVDLVNIVKTLNETSPAENTTKLSTEVTNLYNNWNKSKVNKFIRWGTKKPQPKKEKADKEKDITKNQNIN